MTDPEKEASRLQALHDYAVLDTPPEQPFDDIARLASYICQTPIALVSLVDGERQWFKAAHGLDTRETPREQAFCAHAIAEPKNVMVVGDASEDSRFAGNPLVTGNPHVRFYAGAPLVTPAGEAIGTLCVIDREPRQLDPEQLEVLQALSRQVVAQLELRRNVSRLNEVIADGERYMTQLEQYQRKLEETQASLHAQNNTDALTGVNNRKVFQGRLDEEFARARRQQQSTLSLLMIDVDHFKAYNDTHGHPAGDDVLRGVAKALRQAVRSYDVVSRYGGEEFAVILPTTDRGGAQVIAERCRRAIERGPWPLSPVTASVGVATIHPGIAASVALIEEADRALYDAKRAGRNRVTVAAATDAPGARV